MHQMHCAYHPPMQSHAFPTALFLLFIIKYCLFVSREISNSSPKHFPVDPETGSFVIVAYRHTHRKVFACSFTILPFFCIVFILSNHSPGVPFAFFSLLVCICLFRNKKKDRGTSKRRGAYTLQMKLNSYVRQERLASQTPFPYVAFLVLCFLILTLFGIFLPPSLPSSSSSISPSPSTSNVSPGPDSAILPPIFDKDTSPIPPSPSSLTASAYKTIPVTAATVTTASIHAVTTPSSKPHPTSGKLREKSRPTPTPNLRPRPRPKQKQAARKDDTASGFDVITRKDQH
ncbi:hypothetical protein EDD21DRAFT_382717 [Dissophora ornata]|nr:hypothetical protein EDD21DRAFT_382717 [Dissophora ornata]